MTALSVASSKLILRGELLSDKSYEIYSMPSLRLGGCEIIDLVMFAFSTKYFCYLSSSFFSLSDPSEWASITLITAS